MTEGSEFMLQISPKIPIVFKDFRSGCYFIKESEGGRDYTCLYFTLFFSTFVLHGYLLHCISSFATS